VERVITGAAAHDLLRVTAPDALVAAAGPGLPAWAVASLCTAAWVVVRRAPRADDGALPVGVRGRDRAERAAAWLPVDAVAEIVAPEQLPDRLPLLHRGRPTTVPALATVDRAHEVLSAFGLAGGPGGSVGFELATGVPVTRLGSDLDLVVRAPDPLGRDDAARLAARLADLPVRTDVQLETPHGAVSLLEYARDEGPVLVRTVHGPRLTDDPWRP
jgi:phosphoribosyl-dephospho-CoA transferase